MAHLLGPQEHQVLAEGIVVNLQCRIRLGAARHSPEVGTSRQVLWVLQVTHANVHGSSSLVTVRVMDEYDFKVVP